MYWNAWHEPATAIGYLAREELERYLRRFHVPMIDIGMDVTKHDEGHQICGQVILSMPGHHYDGNRLKITRSPRLLHIEEIACPHFPSGMPVGDPMFNATPDLLMTA